MRRRSRRYRSRGQALVEFALLAPIMFLLIIGIIEVGRLVFYYHNLNNAVREGSRYAIVHGSNAFDGCPSGPHPLVASCDPAGNNIRARIIAAGVGLEPAAFVFGSDFLTYSGDQCGVIPCNDPGNDVTLRVGYSYAPIVLSDLIGSLTISAETTLVINN